VTFSTYVHHYSTSNRYERIHVYKHSNIMRYSDYDAPVCMYSTSETSMNYVYMQALSLYSYAYTCLDTYTKSHEV
jgi:hypothetical protein